MEAVGDRDYGLICAVVIEDMDRRVKVKEVRGFGGLYWKEIFHKQLLGANMGKCLAVVQIWSEQ